MVQIRREISICGGGGGRVGMGYEGYDALFGTLFKWCILVACLRAISQFHEAIQTYTKILILLVCKKTVV